MSFPKPLSRLSTKPIPPRERLIFALDVSTVDQATHLVTDLGDSVHFYKLGLQLFMAGGYFEFIEWLRAKDKKVFVDLKFFDVPETVRAAVSQLKERHVTFTTVHGNDAILEAAVSQKNGLKILAVTVLTSLDRSDLHALGFQCEVKELVLSRARRALDIGCDGVISSGLEAEDLRATLGDSFLIVTPGIRPVDNDEVPNDDQKRTMDLIGAFQNGADYIVVGRPIRLAADPRAKAEELQKQIASLFVGNS
jgi:orotidine-5'-phosphate decarboxylase